MITTRNGYTLELDDGFVKPVFVAGTTAQFRNVTRVTLEFLDDLAYRAETDSTDEGDDLDGTFDAGELRRLWLTIDRNCTWLGIATAVQDAHDAAKAA